MPRLDHLPQRLLELERQGLKRVPQSALPSGRHLVACTNDYLGLAAAGVSRETLFSGTLGAGASRLVQGTAHEHLALERELAAWVGKSEALLFSTGYAANLGTIACLAEPGAVIVSDELNHASLIDGCRLSKATVHIAKHRSLEDVERLLKGSRSASARWVVVESYYSMDGDSPDLGSLRALCDQHDAFLMVDEAHALGVFGPRGAGLCADCGVEADILVGTLGKAVGASGAFVAGPRALRDWLYNRARSFVFSTAPSPLMSGLTLEQLRRTIEGDDLRERLHANVAQLRAALLAAQIQPLGDSHGPIVPIVVGSAERALAASAALEARGIIIQAIRPPTVPEGTSRLRVSVNAAMEADHIARIAQAITSVLSTVAVGGGALADGFSGKHKSRR